MPTDIIAPHPRSPVWSVRAAVLSVFDLDSLTAVAELDGTGQAELASFLDSCCEQVLDESGAPWWQLRDAERARVLRDTPRSELRAALESTPAGGRPGDAVQAALTRYVNGVPAQLEELDAAGLRAELRLERWTGTPAGSADESADDIRARLDWLTVTEPLRRLSAQGFVGRADLLAELRAFIQAGPGPGDRGSRNSAFLVEGVGGVGKSSLLAQLIPVSPRPDYLTAYLSFDRGWLIDNGGWSLFDEILRQLGTQLPGSQREWISSYRRRTITAAARSGTFRDQASQEAQGRRGVSGKAIAPLGTLLRELGDHVRLVVVLDTLEELARRDDAASLGIFRFLDQLHESVPGARVMGAGRTLPRTALRASRIRRLAGLDSDEAFTLLQRLTETDDVSTATMQEIISLVGGNPLSLHLAADVLNRTGANPARVIAVAEGDIQGQLYARLLDHIRGTAVRAVAHPGLVVRRITPEVIRDVLAEPCGIAPITNREAAEIFRSLRQEATLCENSPDGDGALVHRADVRAIMLPAIRHDRPATTRAIHQAAVAYYAARAFPGPQAEDRAGKPRVATDPVALRELIYHELMLDDGTSNTDSGIWDYLDAIWDPAAGAEIAVVIDELPPRAQLYITSKMQGLRLAPGVRAAADDDEWRAVVRPRALQLLDAGQPNEALYLVRERRGSSGHALLPDIEVEALERSDRVADALEFAATERAGAASLGDLELVRTLITAQARLRERLGEWAEAWDLWQNLAGLDRDRRERTSALDEEVRVRELVALTSLLRITRRLPRPSDEVAALHAETVFLAERTPDRILAATPSLLRDLAGEIGGESAATVMLAVRTLGLPQGTAGQDLGIGPPGAGLALSQLAAEEDGNLANPAALFTRTQIAASYRRASDAVAQSSDLVVIHHSAGIQVGEGNLQYNTYRAQLPAHVVAGNIPKAPESFQGRDALLSELRAAGSGVTVIQAVSGQGGVGKTQLAAALAREFVQDRWRLVAWVNADTQASTLSGLAAVAYRLGLTAPGTDLEAAAASVRSHLETDGQRCLVVLDNVTNPRDIAPYLPNSGSSQVVITSRTPSPVALGRPVSVDVFTAEESVRFLVDRTGLLESQDAEALAEELGHLPLALDLAAAVIVRERLTYADYQQRLHSATQRHSFMPGEGRLFPRAAVGQVISVALDAVTAADDTGLCGPLLDLVSLLSPAGVSREMLLAAGEAGDLSQGAPEPMSQQTDITGAVTAESVAAAIGRLAGASLVGYTADGLTITMHRLVAQAVRDRQGRNGTILPNAAGACIVLGTARAGLGEAWQNRAAVREWVDHVRAVVEYLGPSLASLDKHLTESLLGLRGWALLYLLDLGDSPVQAIELGEPLLADWQRAAGSSHPGTLSTANNLALAYAAAGRPGDAIPLLEGTLTERMRTMGGSHPDTLSSQANLADAYRETGRLTEAIPLLQQTLEGRSRLLGDTHPDTLASRNSLASAHASAGRPDQAIPLLQETLTDQVRVLGDSHPDTLRSRANLANAYRDAGQLAEAIPLYEQTLSSRQRVLGDDHPSTLVSRYLLASAYQAAGRLAEAIPLYQQNLADCERLLGANHPTTVASRNGLSAAYLAAGRLGGEFEQ